MKIFFDTEFTGLHKDTSLISIGLISETGEKFYGEFTDFKEDQVNDWIKENVIDNLYAGKIIQSGYTAPGIEGEYIARGMTKVVTYGILDWLKKFDKVEWVSDVCHYDFVLLIDALYKHALNMPYGVHNAACHDINQDIAEYYGITEIEAFDKSREEILKEHGIVIEGKKHNALYDAKVIKAIYKIVNKKAKMKCGVIQ